MRRRDFLRQTAMAFATGATGLSGWKPARAQKPRAHVVETHSASVQREHLLDGSALRAMVEEGIRAISGKRTAAVGWKMLVEPNDVVAIKVSASVPGLSTHHALVNEVVRGLVFADVPPENILIWDRFSEHIARYAYPPSPVAERGFDNPVGTIVASEGDENGIELAGYDDAVFYESDEDRIARRENAQTSSRYSNIVTKRATRIINLHVLKSHPITGISGALSSLAFGSVNNTRRFHGTSNEGVPAIADIWTNSVIRDKHTLTIVDALKGAFATGPGYDPSWQWEANRLYFGRDPVALDTVLLNALNERRSAASDAKLRAISRETGYLSRAASLAVGSNDKDDIRHEILTVA